MEKTVTIALTRHNEPDELFVQCLTSIAAQENVRARILVLDQRERPAISAWCSTISSDRLAFECRVIPECGCAAARNAAIRLCRTDILLWTDPDVVLQPNWAYVLSGALLEPGRATAGGKIVPDWQGEPRWYMKANIMKDHYSLIDLGDGEKETDRIIGGSMGIHIGRLGAHAHFDERLGRQRGTLLGGVDAEFCDRVIREGWKVMYVGQTVALHQIPKTRMKVSWIAEKFFYGGISRGLRGGIPSPMNKDREPGDYAVLLFFAPFYLAGLLVGIGDRTLRPDHP